MTTLTEPHPFQPGEDPARCQDCGEGVNTDVHAELSLDPASEIPGTIEQFDAAQNGASEPKKRGRPRKEVQTEERAQMALEERPLEDLALEGQLREWVSSKGGIETARDDFKKADEALGVMVAERELIAGTYRIGAFIVTVSDVAAHQRIKVRVAKE